MRCLRVPNRDRRGLSWVQVAQKRDPTDFVPTPIADRVRASARPEPKVSPAESSPNSEAPLTPINPHA